MSTKTAGWTWCACLWALCLLAPAATRAAEPLTAQEIMRRVDARDDGDRSIREVEMILIDKNENRRVRRIRSYSRDVGEDVHTILFFLEPADVEDTGFLTYDYDAEKDDDQWLYLPALRKTKRIASSDKSGSFMGSDFSYADLTTREVENYDWTLMQGTEVRGEPVWQIQGIPRTRDEIDETGYVKSIVFVRKDNYVVVRAVNWLEKSGRLKYMDVKKLEQIEGIWVATEIHMTTKKGKGTLHKTILTVHDVRFRQDLDADFFSVRQLEKGL
ncbi:MAG TPA: outer membrane lipoprotein-sorting protein [Myxococcota bacterium]